MMQVNIGSQLLHLDYELKFLRSDGIVVDHQRDDKVFLAVSVHSISKYELEIVLKLNQMVRDTGFAGVKIGISVVSEEIFGKDTKICVPSLVYASVGEIGEQSKEFREDRLPSCFVLAYSRGSGYSLSRIETATFDYPFSRANGQSQFVHHTDIGSLGITPHGFITHWPYSEGDKSVSLDSKGTPVEAFYPLETITTDIAISYRLKVSPEPSYSNAIFSSFEASASVHGQRADLHTDTVETIKRCKIDSLAKTYCEFGASGAGFMFHFDPRKGYGSLPSGFGSAFVEIPDTSYGHVLEYGFTGRQLNAALVLAEHLGGSWINRCERVVDFFIANCQHPNGFIYSLLDTDTGKPIFSFGDSSAPKLHYVWNTDEAGNYLRTMVEPMYDLLRCYVLFEEQGMEKSHWLESVERFSQFLIRVQHDDGSWSRGYGIEGQPVIIDKAEFGGNSHSVEDEKSSAAIPIPFLCALIQYRMSQHEDVRTLLHTVEHAGEYLLQQNIDAEQFRGGTMDNPNLADKEASQYVMAALYSIYRITKKKPYLNGALVAAYHFLSWNYTWNVPMRDGTDLKTHHFTTRGMGGINAIWGGGVVDIYALFHVRELYLLGKECSISRFVSFAQEMIESSLQYVSNPDEDFGFADSGMQPEGWGICPQGCDEHMIEKGDIWGSLGWVYSATIDGIDRYEEVKYLEEELL